MPSLFARQNPLDSAKATFSSWDSCMAKSYCKWPVIAAIVIGGLILLSIITCVARCICCGAECACCCFRCCSCCCSGGSRSGHKRVKSDPAPTYPTPAPYGTPGNPYAQSHVAAAVPIDTRPVNQQYRSAPMPTISTTAPPERPQFATFDSTRAVVNDDALPAMPTWKDGRNVHVEVEEKVVPEKRGDLEMNRLDHNGSATSGSPTAIAAVGARRSPAPVRSPVSPMGNNYGYPNDSFVSAAPNRNSPGPRRGPYTQQDNYGRGSPGANFSPIHGAGESYGLMQNNQQGRHSPGSSQAYDQYDQADYYNQNQQGQYNVRDNRGQQGQYGQRDHSPQNQYDQRDYYDEPDHRYNSPAPPPQNNNNTHNYAANNTAPYNNYAPAPARSYTPGSIASYDNYAPPPVQSHTPGSTAPYDNFAPAPAPARSHTPGYTPSESTVYEPSTVSAYPGQQTYNSSPVYPGQQTYQAFQPSAAPQGQQQSGIGRKPVDGMY